MATVAALASMSGIEPMLQAHMKMGLNMGLTDIQIQQMLSIVAHVINQQQANIGLQILEKVKSN